MEPRYWIEIGIAVVTVGSTAFANVLTGRSNAARFTGVVEERFVRVAADIGRLEQVDRDQWKVIAEVKDDVGAVDSRVSRVEGRLNGKAHGAGK